MRCKQIWAIGVAIAALGLASMALPSVAAAHDIAAEIEKVRVANLKYNDVKTALAEGFIPAPPGDSVSAAHEGRAEERIQGFKTTVPVVGLSELAEFADVIVECAPPELFLEISKAL